MDKGVHPPFHSEGWPPNSQELPRTTLIAIAAKIYNALLGNRIKPQIEKIHRKNQNGFPGNRSTSSQFIRRILGVRAKSLEATLFFVDISKTFDSMYSGKMEQILLAYGLTKETVAAITILYKNTESNATPQRETHTTLTLKQVCYKETH